MIFRNLLVLLCMSLVLIGCGSSQCCDHTWSNHVYAATAAYERGDRGQGERSLAAAIQYATDHQWHGSLIKTLKYQADFFVKEQRYRDAEKMYLRGTIVGKLHPEWAEERANCILALGDLYAKKGEISKARASYQSAFEIAHEYHKEWARDVPKTGAGDPQATKALTRLADLLSVTENAGGAKAELINDIEIARRDFGPHVRAGVSSKLVD